MLRAASCILLVVAAAAPIVCAAEPWEADIRAFEAADRAEAPPPGTILFVGSSSIRLWDTDRFFQNLGVINRGFGGSQIADAIRYAPRIVLPYRPRTIVLYAGDNDIAAGKSAETVLADYRRFVELVHEELPATRIVFIAIKPSVARWHLAETIRRANGLVQAYGEGDPRLAYADIFLPMLGADGKPRPELLGEDGLHLSPAGYALWSGMVRPLLAPGRQEIWVTNAYGDDVHIYEVGTWKLIHHMVVGANPHGISATADGSTVHIALEKFGSDAGELIWVDTQSFRITDRVAVGPLPNEIECTPDGRWIYVPCADGHYWVVDGLSKRVVKRIHTGGRPHNTTLSPDGRHMYLSPMATARHVTIVDAAGGHEVIGRIPFDNAPRPPAISPDGLRFFQHIDGLVGFQVADIPGRRLVATVKHAIPDALRDRPTRCHGLAVRPDQQEIWSCNVDHQRVHVHELISGDYREIATLQMPGRIYWLSFTPDSRYGFVSVRSEGKVAVVDTRTKQIVTYLAGGNTPKRTQVITVDRGGGL